MMKYFVMKCNSTEDIKLYHYMICAYFTSHRALSDPVVLTQSNEDISSRFVLYYHLCDLPAGLDCHSVALTSPD